ncbi:DUF3455 domain-containing protein [Herbaspirillum aquaticum]|uniref:DUF3455 domain-containing protein n=1 Tax=Herbaspirillum aquaticum TaxID=568783 RepID=A0A225SVA7_9BURK|nr:DUF3455 domain-containing protein [Herbaspirillum aquaticum]OWY34596.1 hypothetical protein CEJ45_12205 [Herbaspirillum aquaticum]
MQTAVLSSRSLRIALPLAAALTLVACAPMSTMYSQDSLPDAVKVPAGNKVVLQTVGVGEILYECRAKKDMPGQFEWTFVGPDAVLKDRSGMQVGRYYGPPATWESSDGSKVTGAQVAVAPAGTGNIPHQLVKANPATGMGAMTQTTYIQRVATKSGVAPADRCDMGSAGAKQKVGYQADYIFWKAS